MGKREDRQERITEIIQRHNGMSTRELAAVLGVSEMTVRRDLALLSEKGMIQLIHGGAIYNSTAPPDTDLRGKTNLRYQLAEEDARNVDAKRRIGAKAATLIAPNEIIIIDSGSTTIHLAESIPDSHPFTAIFWALNIMEALRRKKECTMIFTGGYYHQNTMMFESPEGVNLVRRNRANKGFFAAGGVSDRLGVTNSNPYAVEIKQAALSSSLTKVLMVDSTKFGDIKPALYAELSDFDIVITDDGINEAYETLIQELGIELHVV
jgi:DeoR family deoxyribose operon repressor